MSQVTETSTVPVVQNGDFKVLNKNVIILRRFLRNKAAVFGLIVFICGAFRVLRQICFQVLRNRI